MTKPLNIRGSVVEAFNTSTTQSHALGTRMHVDDRRVFRYARASSTAIGAGLVIQEAQQDYALRDLLLRKPEGDTVYFAAGQSKLTLFVGAGLTSIINVDDYRDGLLYVVSGTGAGLLYHVQGNAEFRSSKTPPLSPHLTVSLSAPTQTALDSTSRVTLLKNRLAATRLCDLTTAAVGVTPVAVPASSYFWLQTSGPCAVLQQDDLLNGKPVSPSRLTRGAVQLSTVVIPVTEEHALGATKPAVLDIQRTEGYALVPAVGPSMNVTGVNANDRYMTRERLAMISGRLAVVPDVSIGFCVDAAEHGNSCLIWLNMES